MQGTSTLGSGHTLTASYPGPARSGDLLVGVFRAQNAIRVTDSLNGPWTRAIDCGVISIWYRANAKPGTTSVTLDSSSTTQVRMSLAEYRGAETANPLDQVACRHGSTASVTIPASASSSAGELAVAGVGTGSNQ